MPRPELNNNISIQDFKDFYWLKSELVAFCKKNGISSGGGKIDVAKRIAIFLQTGERPIAKKQKSISQFDWHNAELKLDTVITDNYKTTYNVRAFMSKHIGAHFRLNVEFIAWTKQNIGKTLREAIAEWQRIYRLKKDKNHQTTIAPQFEYNTYMRDFLAANPDKDAKTAMKFWQLKRQQRGSKKYSQEDLLLG